MISWHLIESINTQQLVSLKISDDAAADDDDEHPQERLVTKRRPTYLASGKWPSAARRLSARRALPKDTTALSLVVSLSITLSGGYEDGILRWALLLLAFEEYFWHFVARPVCQGIKSGKKHFAWELNLAWVKLQSRMDICDGTILVWNYRVIDQHLSLKWSKTKTWSKSGTKSCQVVWKWVQEGLEMKATSWWSRSAESPFSGSLLLARPLLSTALWGARSSWWELNLIMWKLCDRKKSNLLYIVISTTGTSLIFHKCQKEHLVL